eukprot:m.209828 g.209828  ORF g.209828 m.209828 type:complete len:391 (+) comp15819_c0_seq20:260-1432(+)
MASPNQSPNSSLSLQERIAKTRSVRSKERDDQQRSPKRADESASLDAEELFRLQLQSIDNAKDNLGESGELEVTDIQVHLPPRVIAEDWEEEEEEASSNEEHQDFNRTVEILGDSSPVRRPVVGSPSRLSPNRKMHKDSPTRIPVPGGFTSAPQPYERPRTAPSSRNTTPLIPSNASSPEAVDRTEWVESLRKEEVNHQRVIPMRHGKGGIPPLSQIPRLCDLPGRRKVGSSHSPSTHSHKISHSPQRPESRSSNSMDDTHSSGGLTSAGGSASPGSARRSGIPRSAGRKSASPRPHTAQGINNSNKNRDGIRQMFAQEKDPLARLSKLDANGDVKVVSVAAKKGDEERITIEVIVPKNSHKGVPLSSPSSLDVRPPENPKPKTNKITTL